MNCGFEGSILLVGEGDFSFSVAMVKYIPENFRKYVVSSSLESEVSIQKHKAAVENMEILRKQGVLVLLETDATSLDQNPRLKDALFDRIIFNFPHSGGKSNHKKNRKLLSDFFISAFTILSNKGQIFMSLCKGQGGTPADQPMRAWPDSWQVVSMAANASLILKQVLPFNADDFLEYSCTGFRSQDKGFNTLGAITHVFEKGETIRIPAPEELLNLDRYSFVKDSINRTFFQEDNHPVGCVYRRLEESFSTVFTAEFCLAPDPVLNNSEIGNMKDCVYNCDCINQNDGRFYQFSDLPGEEGNPTIEMSIINSSSIKNDAGDKSSGESTKDNKKSQENYIPGEITQRSDENIDSGETTQTLNREVSAKTEHLRFSMLEHYNMFLELILDDISDLDGCKPTDRNDPNTEETIPSQCKACLTLQCMTGQVFRPSRISPLNFPVGSEMLGIILVDLSGNVNSAHNASSVCEKLLHSLKFKDLELILDCKEDCIFKTDILNPVGTINISGTNSIDKCTACHLFSTQKLINDKTYKLIIFVLDLNVLTKCVFRLPCIQLLFSNNLDFSKQFSMHPDKSFFYQPFSLYPVRFEHDMSFWENEKKDFDEFLLFDVIRGVAGSAILSVDLIDSYVCEISGRRSRCYRLQFQSHDKVLSYNASWKLQSIIRLEVAKVLQITLR